MRRNFIARLFLSAMVCSAGCTGTKYITDKQSIDRQNDMRKNRTGINVGDVLQGFANFLISGTLNAEYEIPETTRAFKRLTIENTSADTLFVNMVTDVKWKDSAYCDIMGVVLPPKGRQKVLTPFPAAYNVYFRTPFTEEEKIEFENDRKIRHLVLHEKMTK